MELTDSDTPIILPPDRRRPIPEPPPVRLIAVEDVTLLTQPGTETKLDRFYVDVLRFVVEGDSRPPTRPIVEPILGDSAPDVTPANSDRPLPELAKHALQGRVYRAENRRISFQILEPLIEREGLRPLGIEVPSLPSVMLELDRLEIEYTQQRSLHPGQHSVLLQDPAGNWLAINERRTI